MNKVKVANNKKNSQLTKNQAIFCKDKKVKTIRIFKLQIKII